MVLLAVTWPLYLVGFFAGEVRYPISASTIVYLFLSIFVIKQRVNRGFSKFFTWVFLFLAYQLVVFVFLGREGGFTSAILLSVLMLPLIYRPTWNEKEKLRVLNALSLGFYFCFAFLIAEIVLSFQGMKLQMALELPFVRPLTLPSWERLRFFSTFDEPAHFALYLVMLYAIFDLAEINGLRKFKNIEKVLIGFSTVISLSMSGVLLFLIYIVFARGFHVRKRRAGINFVKKVTFGLVFAVILLMVATFFFDNLSNYFLNRISRTIETFTSAEFAAEGIRTNTIRLLAYLKGIGQIFGYPSEEAAGVFLITGDPDFKIANTFVNIVIRLGYVGLFMYLALMIKIINRISSGMTFIFFLFNFALGFWISVLYWIPWIFIYFFFYPHVRNRNLEVGST